MSRFIETLNLQDDEKLTLIKARSILKDSNNDLFIEDGEDTDEYHYSEYACKAIEGFLDTQQIKYEDVETDTELIDGITQCCGYDFGAEGYSKKNRPCFCPKCGRKIKPLT